MQIEETIKNYFKIKGRQFTLCKTAFGGSLLLGKRKSKRPITSKKSIHLILRLNPKYSGPLLSPLYKKSINCLKATAFQYEINIHELAFNFTHLHIVIKVKNRKSYIQFIRTLTQRLTFLARKQQKIKTSRIFLNRPYTRIVNWGRSYKTIIQYIYKNHLESGVLNHYELFIRANTS
jgi:REP element-mobilizing transposase RayT